MARSVSLVIEAKSRDLGGFSVRRAVPSMQRRMVGPFIFFDHFGPTTHSIDVRPHPHIELATVSYLFDGEMDHRDSLGHFRTIRPGDVNWMLAGRGIVHSERSGPEARKNRVTLHGIQSWVALPLEHERDAPHFEHHAAQTIPHVELEGARLDIIAGDAYGARSPVGVLSPTLYAHAQLDAGAKLPIDDAHAERAIYVAEGSVRCEDATLAVGTLAILEPGRVAIEALAPSRVLVFGGARLEGERHIEWNFVSSSKERIAKAKDDWKSGRFPIVPGDEEEFIPLPEP